MASDQQTPALRSFAALHVLSWKALLQNVVNLNSDYDSPLGFTSEFPVLGFFSNCTLHLNS